MTTEEAIGVLESINAKTDYLLITDDARSEALEMAISALQAQDSKTIRICDTCKHDPPEMDKWPCMDCDMREPADRWEAKDVPDTNVGDMISRQAAFDIINVYADRIYSYMGTPNDSEVYAYARGLLLSIERNIRALPSTQSEQNAYEQGKIAGRVEMRTEILCALKNLVGSEVWNNV